MGHSKNNCSSNRNLRLPVLNSLTRNYSSFSPEEKLLVLVHARINILDLGLIKFSHQNISN